MKRSKTKIKTLDMFLGKPSEEKASKENKVQQKQQGRVTGKKTAITSIKEVEIEKEVDELLSQLFTRKETQPKKEKQEEKQQPKPKRKEEKIEKTGKTELMDKFLIGKEGEETKQEKPKEEVAPTQKEEAKKEKQEQTLLTTQTNNIVIKGELLQKLLKMPVGPERAVSCNNTGVCSDGKKISEIYVDEAGIVRQRGFIRTSRIPVILDWVVEHGKIEKVLPKAYKLVTDRGAMALVPEDFICELVTRYGVIVENYDCKNYQVSLTGSARKKK
ncbi:hypothetical protein J4526_09655 [Desulfurococcaceae archaeon MEX13E-LK6-19]|nr:hypothetical protein J4526_09655 [Desulfurococcaceae archaeon MEX13E-LK6-19]